MAFTAAIVTPWVPLAEDPSEQPSNHPQLADDYALLSWTDITGQLAENIEPNPNEYTVEVIAEDSVLDAIEADDTYEILWSEEIADANA